MINNHETIFHGLEVKVYDGSESLKNPEKYAWKLTYDWDDESKLSERFTKFVEEPEVGKVQAIVIGAWEEAFDESPEDLLEILIKNKDRLSSLKAIFAGDMTYEECEMSWIIQGSYEKILEAFPNLEELRIRGIGIIGTGGHANLKKLIVETGGMPEGLIQDVAKSSFPELTHLELWLGVEEYGFDGSIETVKNLLNEGSFPRLKYLGLRNSEIVDEIAAYLSESNLLDNIEILDLSLGTLSDKGGKALLEGSKIKNLKKLNLSHHYLSNEMMEKLKGLGIDCDVSDQQEEDSYDDEIYRSVYVSE